MRRGVALAVAASAAWLAAASLPEAGISFFAAAPPRPGEQLRFRFEQGGAWRSGAIRRSGNQDQPPYDYRIAARGMVRAQASLVRNGRPLARATIRVPVEPDRRYMVYAAVQADDPTRLCMGCSATVSAPVAGERGSGARRLWLYYSFNGISHPILF
jgi:hypothetical protein